LSNQPTPRIKKITKYINLPGSTIQRSTLTSLSPNSVYDSYNGGMSKAKIRLNIELYLSNTKGVFSDNVLSKLVTPRNYLIPKSSGLYRDQNSTLFSKIANLFARRGNKPTMIKIVAEAFIFVNQLLRMRRNCSQFNNLLTDYSQLLFMNKLYNKESFSHVDNITNLVKKATPHFCVKKHYNNTPGRKRKNPGRPNFRSYVAFIKPHGRRLMTLRWIFKDIYKLDKTSKLRDSLIHVILKNSVLKHKVT